MALAQEMVRRAVAQMAPRSPLAHPATYPKLQLEAASPAWAQTPES